MLMQFQIPISSEIDLRTDIVHLHRTYARMHACTPLHMVYGCRMVVGPCATLLVTRAQVYVRFSRWMAVDTMARRERRCSDRERMREMRDRSLTIGDSTSGEWRRIILRYPRGYQLTRKNGKRPRWDRITRPPRNDRIVLAITGHLQIWQQKI